jgi:hypothetical protein
MTSQAKPEGDRLFVALYRDRKALICAASSYEAQSKAATQFKAKRRFDVTVYLSDAPISTAAI